MKINDKDVLSSSLQNIVKTGAGTTPRRPTLPATGTNSSDDAVNLNSHSRILAAGSAAGESARAARVAELRQLYVNGQHTVDAHELSRAIIDAHLSGV